MSRAHSVLLVVLLGAASVPSAAQAGLCAGHDAQLTPAAPQALGYFGRSLALQNGTLLVGAPGHDAGPAQVDTGRVEAFTRTSAGWTRQAIFEPVGLPSGAGFATSLALDGDVAVVGAPGDDGATATSGAVWVFERMAGVWGAGVRLLDPVGAIFDGFGESVAISGDTIAVGARGVDGTTVNQGAVFVFRRIAGAWVLEARLTHPGGLFFGWSVDLDSDRLAAGSSLAAPVFGKGAAHVFERTASTWSPTAILQEPFSSGFGAALSLDGDLLVVGDFIFGRASVFEHTGSAWTGPQSFLASAFYYGFSVDVDGDRWVVGVPYDTTIPPANDVAGSVGLYEKSGATWTESFRYENCEGDSGAMLGWGVALDGDDLAMGLPGRTPDPQVDQSGAVIVFESPRCFEVYCTWKPNSLGCAPRVTTAGTPSLVSATPFDVIGNNIVPNEIGLLVYGSAGRANLDFHGGKLCVKLPATRVLPKQGSGNSAGGPCPGELRYDFNAYLQSGADAALTVGARVNAQWRYRDPAASFGDGLTDAVEFCVNP